MFTISEQRRDGVFDNRAERGGCKKIERSCVFTSCVPGVCRCVLASLKNKTVSIRTTYTEKYYNPKNKF